MKFRVGTRYSFSVTPLVRRLVLQVHSGEEALRTFSECTLQRLPRRASGTAVANIFLAPTVQFIGALPTACRISFHILLPLRNLGGG